MAEFDATVGIIGAGSIGRAFATRLAGAGLRAVISNRRGPESLAGLVGELAPFVRAATVREAAEEEMVLLAIPWQDLPEALSNVPDWEGRIVIDATNPILPTFSAADLGGRTSTEVVSDMVPGGRVVKAFNTLDPGILGADPRALGGRRVIFFSGDHARAKAEVARLIDRLGFAGIDLGGLAQGGRLQQFPGGPLPALDLILLG